MLRHVAKHSKQRKTTKLIKLQWIASIWCQNDQKSQNYKSNQIPINLHRFEVKTIKTTLNYKRDQITMNLHQFDVKTIKNVELRRKTTKLIKLQWIASIWCQNDQNNAKLQTRSNYNEFASIWHQNYKNVDARINLHRFEVKTIKTTLNYKRDQITMNCIDLMSKRSKQR